MPTTTSTDARARAEKSAALHAELDTFDASRGEAIRLDLLEQLDELNVAAARAMGLRVGAELGVTVEVTARAPRLWTFSGAEADIRSAVAYVQERTILRLEEDILRDPESGDWFAYLAVCEACNYRHFRRSP
jgi:hypothetical protein